MKFRNVLLLVILFFPLNSYADDDHLSALLQKMTQSTVMIYYLNEQGYAVPRGTGFVVTKDGIVVTANHVVRREGKDGVFLQKDTDGNIEKAEIVYFENIYCKFPDDKKYRLAILSDKELLKTLNKAFIYDYAILKIVDVSENFAYLNMGDYSSAKVGDRVLFTGFPFGKPNFTVHGGMISAKYNDFAFGDKKFLANWIQIDGSINKGNSGGPVVDIKTGDVIGIINTRYVGITRELEELRNKTDEFVKAGGAIKFGGTNIFDLFLQLINNLDYYISVGIGQAVSINYIKEDIYSIKKATMEK